MILVGAGLQLVQIIRASLFSFILQVALQKLQVAPGQSRCLVKLFHKLCKWRKSLAVRLCAREALLLFMIRMAHPPFYSQTPQHPCGNLIIICLEVNPKCKCIFLTFLNSVLAGLSALSLQSKWKEERCMWLSVPYQGCRPCLEAPVLGCFTLLKLIVLGLALPE